MEPHRLTLGIPDLPGKAVEVARYNTDSTRETLATIDVNGKLSRPAQGAVNLLPICMGVVAVGSNTILGGTGNFSVTRNTSAGLTDITIDGETFSHTTHLALANAIKTDASRNFCQIEAVEGKLRIYTVNDNGTTSNDAFNFVVYRLN